MKMISARIEGFRNIKSDTIVLSDGITSLVSANSYGKSNVMKGIDFAVEFIHAASDNRRAMTSWRYGIPLNRHNDDVNFTADFVFQTEFSGKDYYVNYGFSFEWIKNHGGNRICGEWLFIKEADHAQRYSRLIHRAERALYKSSETGRCSTVIRVADNELIINRLQGLNALYYHTIVEDINNIQVYIERHLDASDLYLLNPFVKKSNGEFDLRNADDIPRVVYRLKSKYPDQYAILISAFMQLFPRITAIDVKEINLGELHDIEIDTDAPYTISNKVYSLRVQDRNMNQPLDFTSLSDGAKRVFLTLTYTVIARIQHFALMALEEPENSIHPSLLQSYLSVLDQLAGDCRIIVASHSPYIIQYVPTKNIYIGKPNDYGLAEFVKINDGQIHRLMSDAVASSDSVGNYIFELLSGGEDDVEMLLSYLEK